MQHYIFSLLSSNYNLTIDRIIGALRHGKNIVITINAHDKQYLRSKMCMVGTTEAEDGKNRMETHYMV